ncbi:MAG: DUF3052 family protein [Cyclobacteriaceae bacterium]
MKRAGYSGNPLEKKLGFKEKFKIMLVNQPDYYFELFTHIPQDMEFTSDRSVKKNIIHYFAKSAADLASDIPEMRKMIEENGMIWVSWPKKSSKVPTDLDENMVRDIALANGLVDIKVCAVDEVWSGLKLVIRLKDRQ